MLTAEKVRCSPRHARARQGALRVSPVALLLPSPPLRAVAWALPGPDGKAGSPIEPESKICEVVARTMLSRSGLRVTTPTGCPVAGRPTPALRVALPCVLIDRVAGREHGAILPL